jgi:hypothetical protein
MTNKLEKIIKAVPNYYKSMNAKGRSLFWLGWAGKHLLQQWLPYNNIGYFVPEEFRKQ